MAKSWRNNSEISYPIASKHASCPDFTIFTEIKVKPHVFHLCLFSTLSVPM